MEKILFAEKNTSQIHPPTKFLLTLENLPASTYVGKLSRYRVSALYISSAKRWNENDDQ